MCERFIKVLLIHTTESNFVWFFAMHEVTFGDEKYH